MKYICLALFIIIAINVWFSDGKLVDLLIKHDIFFMIAIGIFFVLIITGGTFFVLHSIIGDYNIAPKPNPKITIFQINHEIIKENHRIKDSQNDISSIKQNWNDEQNSVMNKLFDYHKNIE